MFDKTLAYVAQTATEARAVRVRLDYDHNAECPCIYIDVLLDQGAACEEHLRDLYFNWHIDNIPRGSFFSLAIDITYS